jgi:hypothetical protein
LDGIKGLIEEFHLSPEDKAKLQQATAALDLQRESIQAARDQALAQIQSTNITAETKSEDAYVRRARPTFLYVIILGIAYSMLVAPVVNVLVHQGFRPMEIPSAYLELFGVAFLGYTGARTWEKTRGN